EQLLYTGVEQCALTAPDRLLEPLPLPRIAQQRVGPVADQVDGGLEAGEEKHEAHRGGLVLREVLAVVGGADEARDQVLAEVAALAVDELREITADLLHGAGDTAARAS